MEPTPHVLVTQSVSGKRWIRREVSSRDVETMHQTLGLDPIVAEALSARGIDPAIAADHLHPSLKNSMPDPFTLKDMDVACRRITQAIRDRETIGILGDYDVDGTTSAALLCRYFHSLDIKCEVYLPDRMTEGYGPSIQAFDYLKEKGASLCLTVDCGATAHDVLKHAEECGLDVIVLDHHQMTLPPPPAIAVVNPNRPDDISQLTNLSAVGVTFMTLAAVNRQLRDSGGFSGAINEPNLLHWLDLVALGLVCDVMPLTGLTRVLVAQGLKVMDRLKTEGSPGEFPGLSVLGQRAGAKGRASAYHLGFVIGPRINAAGRIGHANIAFRLMTETDHGMAVDLADKLEALNQQRQAVEADVLQNAIAQIEASGPGEQPCFVMATSSGWHPGVIGIVAGRLKEKYRCPALVLSQEDDICKGSGRSVDGVDLGAIIASARKDGILRAGGGHAMAAGLTIAADRLPEFRSFLAGELNQSVEALSTQPTLAIDSIIGVRSVSRELVDKLEQAGPFGNGYPEPRMMLKEVRIRYADVKAGKHVACTFSDDMGNTARSIAFRCVGEPLGENLLAAHVDGRKIAIAGKVKADEWRGGSAAQLIIDDAALL